MSEQPEALRLAKLMDTEQARTVYLDVMHCEAAAELRRLHEVNQELLEAVKLAVGQNDHDMLMTGEELRVCRAAIAKAERKDEKA